MNTRTEIRDVSKRHYWVREDFDPLMDLLPDEDREDPNARNSSSSLVYPKSTEGAFRELRYRGLFVDGIYLWNLVEKGIVQPAGGRPGITWTGEDFLNWRKEDIDAAAEWIYANDPQAWSSWTDFCWVGNLSYGQCVRAFRVAIARYNLPFSRNFEPMAVVSVIEPAEHPDDYARVTFFPKGTKLEPAEVSHEHRD